MTVLAHLAILALVALSVALLPATGDADLDFRRVLAGEIMRGVATAHEARLLMSIARWESHYREDVADCRTPGGKCNADGWDCDQGPFQHHTESAAERVEVCGSLEGAVRVAVRDVRRSFAVARELPEPERLSVYVGGPRWRDERSRRMSRTRWVP